MSKGKLISHVMIFSISVCYSHNYCIIVILKLDSHHPIHFHFMEKSTLNTL